MTAFYQLDEYSNTHSTYIVRFICSDYYDNDISWWIVPGTLNLED